MKKAILHPLLVEQISDYSHLITTENQTKEQFLNALTKLADFNKANETLAAFYCAVKDSLFDTVKRNETTVLFNYSN